VIVGFEDGNVINAAYALDLSTLPALGVIVDD
jgi:hypothetical protein